MMGPAPHGVKRTDPGFDRLGGPFAPASARWHGGEYYEGVRGLSNVRLRGIDAVRFGIRLVARHSSAAYCRVVSNRSKLAVVALFVVVVAASFFVSGLRVAQKVIYVYSPPICGPLKDQFGNPSGDAGPCPSPPPAPSIEESQWEWAPFWVAAD
jgi:hypothetical protein